jgi:hypothetical protein
LVSTYIRNTSIHTCHGYIRAHTRKPRARFLRQGRVIRLPLARTVNIVSSELTSCHATGTRWPCHPCVGLDAQSLVLATARNTNWHCTSGLVLLYSSASAGKQQEMTRRPVKPMACPTYRQRGLAEAFAPRLTLGPRGGPGASPMGPAPALAN